MPILPLASHHLLPEVELEAALTRRHHQALAQHLVRARLSPRANPRFYVCIPAIAVGSWWTWKLEKEHHDHLEHIKHENGGELPVRPNYEYLNIR